MTGRTVNMEVDVSTLTPWLHTLHFQACDADGHWGTPMTRLFLVVSETDASSDATGCPYRYWFDAEELPDSGIVTGYMPGNLLDIDVPVLQLGDGEHTIYLQVSNHEGLWSETVKGDFVVAENTVIFHVGHGGTATLLASDITIAADSVLTLHYSAGDSLGLSIAPDVCYRVGDVEVEAGNIAYALTPDSTSAYGGQLLHVALTEGRAAMDISFRGHEEHFSIDSLDYYVAGPEAEGAVLAGSSAHLTTAKVPESVSYRDASWAVTAIADSTFASRERLLAVWVPASVATVGRGIFSDNQHLAAIVWQAQPPLTATVSGLLPNPNLLIYADANALGDNVNYVNLPSMTAPHITLADAAYGGDFFAPIAFTATNISYSHDYTQTTGLGQAGGWETIALPFDVERIEHEAKGKIAPFASGEHDRKPFWLCVFTGQGFTDADAIRAYVPYIIAMPNNEAYWPDYRLAGKVRFSASNAHVGATQAALAEAESTGFVATFSPVEASDAVYVLNVGHPYNGEAEGSVFLPGSTVRPFQAYRLSSGADAPLMRIADELVSLRNGVTTIRSDRHGRLFNLQGIPVTAPRRGVYIMDGRKIVIN